MKISHTNLRNSDTVNPLYSFMKKNVAENLYSSLLKNQQNNNPKFTFTPFKKKKKMNKTCILI